MKTCHEASRRSRASRRRRFALLCILAGVASISASAQVRPEFRTAPRSVITDRIDRTRTTITPGAVTPRTARATDLGEAESTLPMEHIQLLLRRPAERQAAFDAAVEAMHTPGSSSFHRWLTPELVGSEFGPSPADLATITSFLQSEGFAVNTVGKAGLFVDFTGTAAQVEHTFSTRIHKVRTASGDLHHAAITDASIPQALAPLVAGFVSLTDIPSARPNRREVVPPAAHPPRPNPSGVQPADTLSAGSHIVGPQDFYTIYNETPLLNAASPITGRGVTVAVLEESAITSSDLTQFRSIFAVSPATPVSFVVSTGYGANTCTAPAKLSQEEGEAILDIEWAGAVAPGANLIFMQCATTRATAGIFLSAEAVIDNNLADTMSLSYGVYEGNSTTEDSFVNMLWEQAAAQGETVVVSSGDDGSATEDGNMNNTVAQYGISVNSLSSTNWNVSAGGTDFMDTFNGDEGDNTFSVNAYWSSTNGTGLSSALSYIPETTWNDTCAGSVYSAYSYSGSVTDPAELCGANSITKTLVGGGGGPSKLSTRPRPTWQTNTVYGLPSTATYPNRLQPDLSLFASNGFWGHSLPAYQSDDGGLVYAGGTSFVAPQLAGLFALVMQQTGQRLGQPNYVLYAMAGTAFGTTSSTSNACNGSGSSGATPTASSPASSCLFYDIQTGNNSTPCTAGSTNCFTDPGKAYGILSTSTTTDLPAFSTNAGYDMATGIGSVNITNLVKNWQSPRQQHSLLAKRRRHLQS